jgi:nucleotide-binding universal stress UspA family protein
VVQSLAFHNILCGAGRLPQSASVIATAARLALRLGADLDVLHVVTEGPRCNGGALWSGALPPPQVCESLASRLRDVIARAAFPIDAARVILRAGSPATQILRRATEAGSDVIVIGRRPLSGDRLSLGSIRDAVCGAAQAPVLIVPERDIDGDAASGAFRQIVCAVDSSPTSARALELAVSVAQEGQASLFLIHVIERPHRTSPLADAITLDGSEGPREWMRAVVSDTARHWAQTRVVVAYGSRKHHIVSAADSINADLIVIGTRADTADGLSATTQHVMRKSRCSVLVVDAPADRTHPTVWSAPQLANVDGSSS